MGLIEQEIAELKDLREQVKTGKVSLKQAGAEVAVFNQVAKREQLLYNILSLTMKHGSKVQKYAERTNLIGHGTAIATYGEETLCCPEQGGLCITREGCLDFSGQERNMDNCQKCINFTITRQQVFSGAKE